MKFTCWAARSARAAQQWGPYGDSGPMSLVLLQANARVDAPKRASAPCMLPCRRTHSPGPVGMTGAKSVRRCAQTDLEIRITVYCGVRVVEITKQAVAC
jgi:hypothetical protein